MCSGSVHKHDFVFIERFLKEEGRMKTVNTLLITEAASNIAVWKLSVLDPEEAQAAALLIKKGTEVFTNCFSQIGRAK